MTTTVRRNLVTNLLSLFKARRNTKALLNANSDLIDNTLLWALIRAYDVTEVGYGTMIYTLSQYSAIKTPPNPDLNLLGHILETLKDEVPRANAVREKILVEKYYTDKSYKISGKEATIQLKDKLMSLGALYNRNLRGGPGWTVRLDKWAPMRDWLLTIENEYEVEFGSGIIIEPSVTEPKSKTTKPTIRKGVILVMTDGKVAIIKPKDAVSKELMNNSKYYLSKSGLEWHDEHKDVYYIHKKSSIDYFKGVIPVLAKRQNIKIELIIQDMTEEPDMEKTIDLPSVEALNDLTDFFQNDKANYEKFRGSFTMEWGWLMWLQQRYGKKLVCAWEGTRGQGGIFYSWTGTKRHHRGITIEPWFLDHLKECLDTKSRFVVGILSMKVKRGYHANAFIFDLKNRIVSRFEPNGGQAIGYYNHKEVNQTLDMFFKSKATINKIGVWKYESPSDFCPVGPQVKAAKHQYEKKVGKVYGKQVVIEAGGFCAAWSLMFIHYKLLNPDRNDQDIIQWLLGLSSEKLSNMVREYAAFVVNNIDRHWDAKEAHKRLDVDDIVEFKRGKEFYVGVLVKKLPKNAVVLFDRPVVKRRSGKYTTLVRVPMAQLRLAENIDTAKLKTACQTYLNTFKAGKYITTVKAACDRL